MKINTECTYYFGSKPCSFHKKDGRLCDGCNDYTPLNGSILIIKLDALGDVLRSTAILPALKKKYPGFSVTWVTRRNAIPLLEDNPVIDRVLTVEGNYLQYILNENFDAGICLDADPASSTILSLAKCGQKFGFISDASGRVIPANHEAHEWYLMGLNDDLKKGNRRSYPRIIHEICRLDYDTAVARPQFFPGKAGEGFASAFSGRNRLKDFRIILGINTGGGNRWECKKWILENYIELIFSIKENDGSIGIILFGGPQEVEFNRTIIEKTGQLAVDAGCLNSVSEFASLVNLCNVFFTPDSLGMHISTALGKTTIVVVGPTSPWELEVYGNGEIIFNEDLECLACYDAVCRFDKECMRSLTPELIFSRIKKFL